MLEVCIKRLIYILKINEIPKITPIFSGFCNDIGYFKCKGNDIKTKIVAI